MKFYSECQAAALSASQPCNLLRILGGAILAALLTACATASDIRQREPDQSFTTESSPLDAIRCVLDIKGGARINSSVDPIEDGWQLTIMDPWGSPVHEVTTATRPEGQKETTVRRYRNFVTVPKIIPEIDDC